MNSEPPRPRRTSAVVNALETCNRRYESRLIDCGKIRCSRCGGAGDRHPSHGPYWYLCFTHAGRWHRQYLGKTLDTNRFITSSGNLDMTALLGKRRRSRSHPAQDVHDVPGQVNPLKCQADSAPLAREHPDPTVDLDPPDPIPYPDETPPPDPIPGPPLDDSHDPGPLPLNSG